MRTGLVLDEVRPKIRETVKALYHAVPAGVGSGGAIPKSSRAEMEDLVVRGAPWAIERGYGRREDLAHIEDGGTYSAMPNPSQVSDRAFARGAGQIGTLGSGNHFLEIDVVDEVFLPDVAARMGFVKGGVAISIHTGSRGFGYQVCEDSLRVMQKTVHAYGIALPDRQLACAPIASPEGQAYLGAMACAANFAWVNRQVIMALVERTLCRQFGKTPDTLGMRLIYDVCHNIAKIEEHEVDGERRTLCVHRKGATRAFGPGHPVIPEAYRDIGQPVFIPGDMGRYSYVLIGAAGSMRESFGSTCHGAGRMHSRTAMIKAKRGTNVFKEMEDKWGVVVMAQGYASAAEEMPEAYKDVAGVVEVCEKAGLSRRVVRLRPIGCVKG